MSVCVQILYTRYLHMYMYSCKYLSLQKVGHDIEDSLCDLISLAGISLTTISLSISLHLLTITSFCLTNSGFFTSTVFLILILLLIREQGE